MSAVANPPPNIFENIQTKVLLPAFHTLSQTASLFPDSLLFGGIALYLLTMNNVFGVFALFLFETSLFHSLVAWVIRSTYGPTPATRSAKCETGFRVPRLEVERIFPSNSWPSRHIFSLYAIASYLIASTAYFQDTLVQMGPEWTPRASFAYSFIAILTLGLTLSRWMTGCDGLTEIFVAAFFGLLVGIILFSIHKAIFGPEGINFLGLPFLVDRTRTGSDIYVCAPQAP